MSSLQSIGADVSKWKWKGWNSWPSAIVRGPVGGTPHLKCIDVMEGEIMDA